MAIYDETIKKHKKYLKDAQLDAIVAKSQQYSRENAGVRAGAVRSAVDSYDTAYRGLQNMGLAGRQGTELTGEVPRLKRKLAGDFNQTNAALYANEKNAINAYGNALAEQTKAEQAAAKKAAEAEKQKQLFSSTNGNGNPNINLTGGVAGRNSLGIAGRISANDQINNLEINPATTLKATNTTATASKVVASALSGVQKQATQAVSGTAQKTQNAQTLWAAQQAAQVQARKAKAAMSALGITQKKTETVTSENSNFVGRNQAIGAAAAVKAIQQKAQTTETAQKKSSHLSLPSEQKQSEQSLDKATMVMSSKGVDLNTRYNVAVDYVQNAKTTSKKADEAAERVIAEANGLTYVSDAEYEKLKKEAEEAKKKYPQISSLATSGANPAIQAGVALGSNLAYSDSPEMTALRKAEQDRATYAQQAPTLVQEVREYPTRQKASEKAVSRYQALKGSKKTDKETATELEKILADEKILPDTKIEITADVLRTADEGSEVYDIAKRALGAVYGLTDVSDTEYNNLYQMYTMTNNRWTGLLPLPGRNDEAAAGWEKAQSNRAEYKYYIDAIVANVKHNQTAEMSKEQEKDDLSRYINDPESFSLVVPDMSPNQSVMGQNIQNRSDEYRLYKAMTDEQRGAYNYIYQTEGKEAAHRYFADLKPLLLMQRAQNDEDEWKELVNSHPATAAVLNAMTVTNSLSEIAPAISRLGISAYNELAGTNTPQYIDTNSSLYGGTNMRSAIRSATSEAILGDAPGYGRKALNFAYQTGMSMADSASMMPFAAVGASWLTDLVFYSSASNEAFKDAKARGGTQAQAMRASVAAGVAEALFEHVSLDKVLKAYKTGDFKYFKNVLQQAGIEASEEFFTELSNIFTDTIFMDNLSNISLERQEYIAQGMSVKEADTKVFLNRLKEVSLAALGGGVSGFLFGLFGNVSTKLENERTGTDIRNQKAETKVVQMAELMGGDAATLVKEAGSTMTDTQLGEIYHAVQEQAANGVQTEENMATLATVLEGQPITSKQAEAMVESSKELLDSAGYDTSSAKGLRDSYNQRLKDNGITSAQKNAELTVSADDPLGVKNQPYDARKTLSQNKAEKAVSKRTNASYTVNEASELGKIKLENTARAAVQGNVYATGAVKSAIQAGLPTTATAVDIETASRARFPVQSAFKQGNVSYELSLFKFNDTMVENLRNGQTKEQYMHATLRQNLSQKGKATLDFYEAMGEALGAEVVIHDFSATLSGSQADGKLHFYLSGDNTAVRTFSHETLHLIKEMASEKYTTLTEYLKRDYGAEKFNNLLETKAAEYGMELNETNRSMLEEEAFAELSEKMLSDTKALEKFANKELDTAKTFRGQLQKVSNAIHKALNKLGLDLGTSAAKDIKYAQDTVDAWLDGMTTAISNAQKRMEQGKQQSGIKYSNNDIRLSLAQKKAFDEYVQNALAGAGNNSKNYISIGEVSPRLVADLKKQGVDISGRMHIVRDNDIRHMRNSHGIFSSKNGINEYGVTTGDIQAIPYIVENYTDVRPRLVDGKLDSIVYRLAHDDMTYYVEVSASNKMLEGKQMIKSPKDTIPNQYIDVYKERSTYGYPDKAANAVPGSYAQSVPQNNASKDSMSDSKQNVKEKFSMNDTSSNVEHQEEAERAKAYATKAEKRFGITGLYKRAGYLTINGKMLDFSDGQRYRVMDHREISDILDLPEDAGYSDGLIEFMRQGNIRMQEYGIDIATKPNDKQRAVLTRFFNSLNGEVTVDFSKENGDVAGSIDYPEGTKANKILSDIDHFADTGEVRELSEMQRFHFSLNDSFKTDQAIRKVLGKAIDEATGSSLDIDYSYVGYDTYKKFREVIPQLRKYVNGKNMSEKAINGMTDTLLEVMGEVLDAARGEKLEGWSALVDDLKRFGGFTISEKQYREVKAMGYTLFQYQAMVSKAAGKRMRVSVNHDGGGSLEEYYDIASRYNDDAGHSSAYDINEPYAKSDTDMVFDVIDKLEEASDSYTPAFESNEERELILYESVGNLFYNLKETRLQEIEKAIKQDEKINDKRAAYEKGVKETEERLIPIIKTADAAYNHAQLETERAIKAQGQLADAARLAGEMTVARQAAKQVGKLERQLEKANQKHLENKQKHQQQVKELKKAFAAEKKAAVKSAELAGEMHVARQAAKQVGNLERKLAKSKEEIKGMKKQHKTDLKEAKATATAKERDRVARQKVRRVVKQQVRNLERIYNHPKNDLYVPQDYLSTVKDFLTEMELYTSGSERSLRRIDRLQEAYETLRTTTPYDSVVAYDEGIAQAIKELREITSVDGNDFSKLSLKDLQKIMDVVNSVSVSIQNAVEFIGREKDKGIAERAEKFQTQAESNREKFKHYTKVGGDIKIKALKAILSPERYARFVSLYDSDSVLVEEMQYLNQGQNRVTAIEREALRPYEQFMNEHGKEFADWQGKGAKLIETDMKDVRGNPVKITPAMRISLVAQLKNRKNLNHLLQGGFRLPNMNMYAKGKFENMYDTGVLVKPTMEQLNRLEKGMSDLERQYLQLVERTFNEYLPGIINDTSMQLNGYKKAREKNYFPIITDSAFLKGSSGVSFVKGDLENAGWLQERKEKSYTPVLLQDVNQVLERQIEGVATYGGLAIPIANFERLMNASSYTEKTENGKTKYERHPLRLTIQESIPYGESFISNLMDDLKGGSFNPRSVSKLFSAFQSTYIKSVLALNVTSFTAQLSSYPATAAVVGWNNAGKALVAGKADYDTIYRYSEIAWDRSRGYASPELKDYTRNRKDWTLKHPKLEKAVFGWMNEGDKLTIGRQWKAAEFWVQEHSDLKRGTEAYYLAVGKKLNEIIQTVQENSSVMQRAEILRDKKAGYQPFTIFKTQQFQIGGMVADSMLELALRDRKKMTTAQRKEMASRCANRILLGFALAASASLARLLGNLVRGTMKNYRDDDNELTKESIFATLLDEFAGNFAGMFPFMEEVKELLYNNIFKGERRYDMNDISTDVINTILDTAIDIPKYVGYAFDADKEPSERISYARKAGERLLNTVGQLTGIPFENARKLINGYANMVMDLSDMNKYGSLDWFRHNAGQLDNEHTHEEYNAAREAGISGKEFFSWKKRFKDGTAEEKRQLLFDEVKDPKQAAVLDSLLIPSDSSTEQKVSGTIVYTRSVDKDGNPKKYKDGTEAQWQVKADYGSADLFNLSQYGNDKYMKACDAMKQGADIKKILSLYDAMAEYNEANDKTMSMDEKRSWIHDNVTDSKQAALLDAYIVSQGNEKEAKVEGNVVWVRSIDKDGKPKVSKSGEVAQWEVATDYSEDTWYKLSQMGSDGNDNRYQNALTVAHKGGDAKKVLAYYEYCDSQTDTPSAEEKRDWIYNCGGSAEERATMDSILTRSSDEVKTKGAIVYTRNQKDDGTWSDWEVVADYSGKDWYEVSKTGYYEKAKKAYSAVGIKPSTFSTVYEKWSTITAKDASGKTVSGLKKKRTIAYLNTTSLTSAQKQYFLTQVCGYK